MKLSVIIVNFNVVFYLEQCLCSVYKALQYIDGDVFVIDNNSVDGSCSMIKRLFPQVHLIENSDNIGFSKANNLAIQQAKGEYLLLLNPDTIVEENTFTKIINFMDQNYDAGALGVRMIDGTGKFLPESKRGFPSPKVAFYKVVGLSKIFPRSKTFNTYHLGYLDKDKTHEVPVLSGACMCLRKSVIDKIGNLDEDYFMYGEDIDISFRIKKAGFKNYYFPDTTIIHFKGKSTRKESYLYVILFYKAMKIFASKHFKKSKARTFLFFINLAIYLLAGASIISRFARKIILPFLDVISIYLGFFLISQQWAHIKFHNPLAIFPLLYYYLNIPIFTFIWLVSLFFYGAYLNPINIAKTLRAILFGFVANLIVFALMPDDYRFSRFAFLLGSLSVFCILPIIRYILSCFQLTGIILTSTRKKNAIVIANEKECGRVLAAVNESSNAVSIVGFVSTEPNSNKRYIGNISQLKEIIAFYKVEEIIFCAENVPEKSIIDTMIKAAKDNIDFKIILPKSVYIVGNEPMNMLYDIYSIQTNSITLIHNKITKRVFDIALSFILLCVFPVLYMRKKRRKYSALEIMKVLCGTQTLISYNRALIHSNINLPPLKKGIFPITPENKIDAATMEKQNVLYVKDYSIVKDFKILFSNFKEINC